MIDRIKQILEFYNLSPAVFAEQIGINRSNLTHLFSGRNQPSLEFAKKILHTFPDIKTEWLIMGVGDMIRNSDDKEFTMKIQQENKLQKDYSEQNLFSPTPPSSYNTKITRRESTVADQSINDSEILESREVENNLSFQSDLPLEQTPIAHNPSSIDVKKIVFFYSDNKFEIFHPS